MLSSEEGAQESVVLLSYVGLLVKGSGFGSDHSYELWLPRWPRLPRCLG